MNNATETTNRNYLKHTYAPGMSKADKAKQRRATRAELKSQAHTNVQGAPTPEPQVTEPETAKINAQAQAEINRKNLQEALNRRPKKTPRTQEELETANA